MVATANLSHLRRLVQEDFEAQKNERNKLADDALASRLKRRQVRVRTRYTDCELTQRFRKYSD